MDYSILYRKYKTKYVVLKKTLNKRNQRGGALTFDEFATSIKANTPTNGKYNIYVNNVRTFAEFKDASEVIILKPDSIVLNPLILNKKDAYKYSINQVGGGSYNYYTIIAKADLGVPEVYNMRMLLLKEREFSREVHTDIFTQLSEELMTL